MPHVPLLPPAQASEEVHAVYEEFYRRMSCCRMLGVDSTLLDDLVRDVGTISDPKLRDMILFAIKCSRSPQSLAQADFDTLREHGLDQSEIVEIIAMSAMAVYANIIADATAMEEDAMFAEIGG